ncbi:MULTISPECIES: helix-turn-helix transcriptional regulator [unclassified Desulfovibrio]|uniref:helix-turn-helix domain-containing protein n=1 Tax=unclassified Desulfovibrio TaxID=2593640 RepID=UPI000F5DD1BC|nr:MULTISPECIES: helix-turn-helix transcriptional regulator [unclassified Desulfovibrio]RRD69506.1 XRE family transcriptional regulator [Desulfovibrio sp. OH1209_COT-279]RRD86185.1 XRE family transcriptional regulator [Desulfovibrio sp. OH1186_COT-070]
MFRSNVNQLLEEKGMSTYALAEKSGISRQSLFKARQDAGISECRLSTLARIARALEVGTKDLFDEKREP